MSPPAVPPVDLPAYDPALPRVGWLLALVAAGLAFAAGLGAGVGPPPAGQPTPTAGVPSAPTEDGAALFVGAGCGACHQAGAGAGAGAPSLTGVAGRAAARIVAPGYAGAATTVQGYLEEAIVDHCVDPLPGYDCSHVPDFGLRLTMTEVTRLAEYLAAGGGAAP